MEARPSWTRCPQEAHTHLGYNDANIFLITTLDGADPGKKGPIGEASIPLPKGFTNDRLRDKPDQDAYMSSERRMLALPPAYLDVGENEIELLPCGGFQSGIAHFLPRPEGLGAVPVATANLTSAELIKYAANAFLSGEDRVDRKPT